MPTSGERSALWFFALVAVLGGGARLWQANRPRLPATDSAAIAGQLDRVDSARAKRATGRGRRTRERPDAAARVTAPPGPVASAPAVVSPVDVDRADTTELATLPGIGPALARRIVAHRDSAGSFGGMGALCDVRGVGPSLAKKLRPLVTFTGARRPLSDECGEASGATRKSPSAQSRKPR